MNYRMISYITGQLVRVEGVLMLLPLLCSLIYNEKAALSLALPALLAIILGTLATLKRPRDTAIYARDGFVTVGLSWIILSLLGALPFFISREIPSFIDAFFETVSGFTTTGATALTDVESLSRGLLFWRSFTHWIGGMGVLVFVLAILPQADTRSVKLMHVMRAEVPGPKVGKLVSKISRTARITYGIYIALTLVQIILLLIGKMSLYDSLLTAFGTAGTGGFGIWNNSMAHYASSYIEWITAIFMVIFSINFNLYYFLLLGKLSEVIKSEELRWFLIIVAASTALVAIDIRELFSGVGETVRYAFFQVSSIISTTGYSTCDFNEWPAMSKTILVLLMFCGSCVGSTCGGIKIGRLILLVKSGLSEIKYMLHPRAVITVRSEGKPVEAEVLRGTNAYMVVYIMLFVASFFFIEMVEECDLVTGFTAVSTCLNNIGPGLGEVGPTGSFSDMSGFSKLLLSFDMLAGRLEIFPLVMLLAPSTWKRS